jgi:hypothetical protein
MVVQLQVRLIQMSGKGGATTIANGKELRW